jgi:hypothetical protein
MKDRTTKALLLAIAIGLWANVLTAFLRPEPVKAQGVADLLSVAQSLELQVSRISRGTCSNNKIC